MSCSAAQGTPRERGNKLFVSGDYAGAAAAYSEGLPTNQPNQASKASKVADVEERATLLSNRAACYLEMGDLAAAEADSRACLHLQPCNVKAHYRLARALPPNHQDAASAIAAAVALCDAASRTTAMLPTYGAIASATVAAAYAEAVTAQRAGDGAAEPPPPPPLRLRLPSDVSRLTAASSWADVESALRRGASFIVLRPGTYITGTLAPFAAPSTLSYTLLGVGAVALTAPRDGGAHAIWLNGDLPMFSRTAPPPTVTLVGVRLIGTGRGAAACVSGDGARLQMIDCRVEDYGEVGLLVAGHCEARLARCAFTRTAAQAVEVREGGALVADAVVITDCRQGVSAYGGARSVVLRDCVIVGSKRENVLLDGSYQNAATEAQAAVERAGGAGGSSNARAVSLAAAEWGRQRGIQLRATLQSCTISRAGCFGVSADHGAILLARGCHLENNDPYAFFIKGGTDATILACRIIYTGARSKSGWGSMAAGGGGGRGGGAAAPPLRQSGIRVGINYGGNVVVVGNAFGGPEELALGEEMKEARGIQEMNMSGAAALAMARKLGMWSKPAREERNSYHDQSPPSPPPMPSAAAGRGRGRGGRGGGGGGAIAAASDAAASPPLPTFESLEQRLPAWAKPGDADGAAPLMPCGGGAQQRRGPAPALLQRTTYTFPVPAWSPTAHEFYAIGNTFGYDVTGGGGGADPGPGPAGGADADGPIRVLLGACGDIRNLLVTAHAVRQRSCAAAVAAATTDAGDAGPAAAPAPAPAPTAAAGRRRRLEFTLNDGNLAMLARDAAMLHMAAELGAPAGAVLAVWANHGLSPSQEDLLSRSLTALATEPWPAWLVASDWLQDPAAQPPPAEPAATTAAEAALRAAFASWSSCTLPLADLQDQRLQRLGGRGSKEAAAIRAESVELSMRALREALGCEEAAEALRGEVKEYVQSGNLRLGGGDGESGGRWGEPLVAANPTLLLAPELQYTVYFSSSIFRALPLSSQPGTATSRLIAALAPQLDSLARGLRDGDVTVRLVPGDILAVMLAVPPPPPAAGPDGDAVSEAAAAPPPPSSLQYDFIDCSNVADYVSLQALVQAAAPLLARHAHARLRAESLVLYGSHWRRDPALTPAGFLADQLLPSPPALQELLGLRAVEGEVEVWPGRGVRIVWAPDLDLDQVAAADAAAAADIAARSSWLTAPRLLLELLPPCKALLTPAVAAAGGALAAGAPLSLVHLLSLSLAPQQLEPMVRCLARCDPSGAAALFKWELTLAAQLQAGRRPPPLRRLSYAAKPGWDLVGCDGRPLLLAFSREALPRRQLTVRGGGGGGDGGGGGGLVKQLMAAFAWDEDAATAHLLLPDSIAEQCGGWFLTLCVVGGGGADDGRPAAAGGASVSAASGGGGGGGGLVLSAVGVSTRLASLKAQPAEGAVAPVRWRPAGRSGLLLDMGLVDRMGASTLSAAAAAAGKPPGEEKEQVKEQVKEVEQGRRWEGAVHVCREARSVTVDVMAPGPLPSAEEAAVTATLEGSAFVVRVKQGPKQGGGGGGCKGGGRVREEEFAVGLPEGAVYGKPTEVRLSRKLGVLSARVELLTA